MWHWLKINYSLSVHCNRGICHPEQQHGSLVFNSFCTCNFKINDTIKWNLQLMLSHKHTCSECGGGRVTGDVSTPGYERHLVLSVWSQAVNAELFVWGGNLYTGFIWGVGAWPIKHGDSVHRSHWLRPADQSWGVCHVLHLHLLGAVNLWGGRGKSES